MSVFPVVSNSHVGVVGVLVAVVKVNELLSIDIWELFDNLSSPILNEFILTVLSVGEDIGPVAPRHLSVLIHVAF